MFLRYVVSFVSVPLFFVNDFMQYCWNTCSRGIVAGSVNFEDGDNYINVFLRNNNFPGSCIEQRLQVLVNLCPAVLELQDDNNPLFDAAENSLIGQYACFISVLIAGIHKLTKNIGILLLFRIITFNSNPVRVLNNLQGEREEYIGREEARERKKERKKERNRKKEKICKMSWYYSLL